MSTAFDGKPLAVLCKQCHTGFGGSVKIDFILEALKIFAFSDLSNVTVVDEAKTAEKGGEDEVSIFKDIICGVCNSIVGRTYIAIPKYPDIQ
ncbi:hypothetical protein ABW19_dt0207691 [Dactylella cylindrospora]|nr:hypothetical protein ABW19_dt0207691 [Dactylella cylindrospora]